MARLTDKVCLITGAASNPGLGHATARRFAEEGATLVLTDIDEAGLSACADEMTALGASVESWRQDVTSESEWTDTMARIKARFGRLDVIVNNAGIAVLKPVEQFTLADYTRQMDVNMTSVFLGTQAALVQMREQGSGSIVNMSSVAGIVGVPGVSVYAASKGGVRLFSKTVAIECAREGIRCNTVHPGVINTNMQSVALRDNPEQYEILQQTIPMGFMGDPVDIANAVLYLACDESRYVTGTELVVDGGLISQ
ncbi:MAG: SDR family NAD(P)-dependent oxidoreductase [Chromatocurvus sp.]